MCFEILIHHVDTHILFYLGVAYIKFSKTSEAATAMEEMNGRCIGCHPRPLKVLIAHSREQGSRRDSNEEERLLRLFVVVPKSMNDSELRDHFAQFGDIDYVSIVKDKNTKESKGFAYVKYHRVSHTAKAFECCERSFKPVFADPRPPKPMHADSSQSNIGSASSTTSNYDVFPYENHTAASTEGFSRLAVVASSSVNQDQLWKLFDIIPGLDYCEKRETKNRQVKLNGNLSKFERILNLNVFSNFTARKVSVHCRVQ